MIDFRTIAKHRVALLMLIGSGSLFCSISAASEPLPRLQDVGTPQEMAVAVEAVGIANEEHDPPLLKPQLDKLDALLLRVPLPSRARGFVQLARSQVLAVLERKPDALIAVDDAVRMLPGFSAPLFAAGAINAYSATPELGADYFIRASRIDPKTLHAMPSSEVSQLLRRLRAKGDEGRIAAFSQRLIDVSWKGNDLNTRSRIVREMAESRLEAGNVAGARTLVPELFNPEDMYRLLALATAKPLWADIEQWAGPKLEKQWPLYLTEARERFASSKNVDATIDYLGALSTAGHNATIVREIAPTFRGPISEKASYNLQYGASKLAGAQATLGRWDEVEAMYARLEQVWPLGEDVNALNLSANHARFLLHQGKTEEGFRLIDRSVKEMIEHDEVVNLDAVFAIHQIRACALHTLGRDSEAAGSVALGKAGDLLDATGIANMYFCLERPAEARAILLRALADPARASSVLIALQPPRAVQIRSDYGNLFTEGWRKMREDPLILARAAKSGRILSFSMEASAPAEQVRWDP